MRKQYVPSKGAANIDKKSQYEVLFTIFVPKFMRNGIHQG